MEFRNIDFCSLLNRIWIFGYAIRTNSKNYWNFVLIGWHGISLWWFVKIIMRPILWKEE